MRKFMIRILAFLAPIIIYISIRILPFYYAAVRTDEVLDIEKCIDTQRSNPSILYGLGYDEHTEYYKFVNAEYYKAPIIALGTSRVMQFKNYYFCGDFYNCGGGVNENYDEYLNFLKNLSYKPETIILGLDAWVFNDSWNLCCTDYNSIVPIKRKLSSKAEIIRGIRDDYGEKWKFKDLNRYPANIGFNGRIKDNGFMIDGSYYYGASYRFPEQQVDYQFKNTLDRIARGADRFEYGNHIDPETIEKLGQLLNYCAKEDIYVIGFLAPFAPQIYNTMVESGHYNYLFEIEPCCSSLFYEHGFEFYDYMNGCISSMNDTNYIDGFHGSEIVYGYIVKDMVRNDSAINQYIDENKLDYLLNNAYDELIFYNPDGNR